MLHSLLGQCGLKDLLKPQNLITSYTDAKTRRHDDKRAKDKNSVRHSVVALYSRSEKHREVARDKKLYAKAMAARWCDKKDRKFCELAFYKLYNYDIAKYLRQNEVPLILSLALYDVERGDHLLTTVRAYVEKSVLSTELGILTGKIDMERMLLEY
jgi:hypothetical protein